MKIYRGVHSGEPGGQPVWIVDGLRKILLVPRFDLRRHSPDGFGWGYAGSGPAQLALALCADALRPDDLAFLPASELRATRVYQQFKFAVIAQLPARCNWTMTQANVVKSIEAIEQAEKFKVEDPRGGYDFRV